MKQIISAAFFLLSVLPVSAQTDAFRQKKFNLDNGLAIKGYDPVAYITDHKAVKGTKEFATADHGVTYYFSSAANRDKFKTSPQPTNPSMADGVPMLWETTAAMLTWIRKPLK